MAGGVLNLAPRPPSPPAADMLISRVFGGTSSVVPLSPSPSPSPSPPPPSPHPACSMGRINFGLSGIGRGGSMGVGTLVLGRGVLAPLDKVTGPGGALTRWTYRPETAGSAAAYQALAAWVVFVWGGGGMPTPCPHSTCQRGGAHIIGSAFSQVLWLWPVLWHGPLCPKIAQSCQLLGRKGPPNHRKRHKLDFHTTHYVPWGPRHDLLSRWGFTFCWGWVRCALLLVATHGDTLRDGVHQNLSAQPPPLCHPYPQESSAGNGLHSPAQAESSAYYSADQWDQSPSLHMEVSVL